MTRPTKHPKSKVYRIRIAVPPALRDIIQRDHGRRSELVETLGTKDAAEAKRRAPPVVAKFEGWLRAAQAEHEGSSVHLTDRDVSAWCGRWLAQQEAEFRDELPSTGDDLDTGADILAEVIKTLDRHPEGSGTVADAIHYTRENLLPLMATEGVAPDAESLKRLAD